jgi:hypothetical protein
VAGNRGGGQLMAGNRGGSSRILKHDTCRRMNGHALRGEQEQVGLRRA